MSKFYLIFDCGSTKTIVKIEFESPDKLESIPDLIELYDEKLQKKSKSIIKSSIKSGIVEMDVSDLLRGTYYLKMSFAKKAETESIRLILE